MDVVRTNSKQWPRNVLKELETAPLSKVNKNLLRDFKSYLFSTGSGEARVAKVLSQRVREAAWDFYIEPFNLDIQREFMDVCLEIQRTVPGKDSRSFGIGRRVSNTSKSNPPRNIKVYTKRGILGLKQISVHGRELLRTEKYSSIIWHGWPLSKGYVLFAGGSLDEFGHGYDLRDPPLKSKEIDYYSEVLKLVDKEPSYDNAINLFKSLKPHTYSLPMGDSYASADRRSRIRIVREFSQLGIVAKIDGQFYKVLMDYAERDNLKKLSCRGPSGSYEVNFKEGKIQT